MAFTSLYFLIFVAAVTGCYYAVPQKSRWIVLLAASYVFYLISSPKTFIFILFTTVVTFFGGRYIGRLNTDHKEYLEADPAGDLVLYVPVGGIHNRSVQEQDRGGQQSAAFRAVPFIFPTDRAGAYRAL